MTVITREDIDRQQVKTLPELLRGIPGLDLTTQGGNGKLTSVFMRGTNSGHVLVLVDGTRIGAATNGGISWEFLPLAEIERIEIVRGPRSTLYGSDAIGGVIQIFTRQGTGPAQPRASVTAGSYHTWEAAAGVSGASGDTRYNLSARRFATGGFNARQPVGEFGTPL
ncbi:MAG: TonB-dependent receptor plug domain-containing protein, partial [Pseudomonadota bacterium]